jgi:predicted dehydrogenase
MGPDRKPNFIAGGKVKMDYEHTGMAVIGCGYWGVNYVRIFHEVIESRVISICDQRNARLYEVGRHFPGAKLATDIDDALNTEGVHAAVICTDATSHFEIARQCIEAGKHVLIEKPMATNSADAEKLIALAKEHGVLLMVGHTFLYNDGIKKLKECINQPNSGRIYYLYARRTNLGPIRHDVNVVWDLASHDIAIFNYLINAVPEWVSAVGSKVLLNSREDVSFISLGYPDGTLGHIHVSWADPHKVREVVVVGSDRRVVFNDLDALDRVRVFEKGVTPTPSEANSFGEYTFLMRDGDIISPRVDVSEPLKNECLSFVKCIREGGHPLTDGNEGLEVIRVMEAIDHSIGQNGKPIKVGEN